MANTQNAFLLPPPAPQYTAQAKQPGRLFDRDASSSDSADTSFMALLSSVVDRRDESEDFPSLPQFTAAFLASREQTLEEYAASFPLPMGDRRVLPKPILDLMVSLKNDLENNSVNLGVWHGKIRSLLNEAGLEWDAAESVMAKLRSEMRMMFLENGDTGTIDAEALMANQLKFGVESLLANALPADDAAAIPEEKFSAPQVTEQAAENGQNIAPQLLQDLNYHPYLKQELSKETLAGQDYKTANVATNAEAVSGSIEKLRNEFSSDFRGRRGEEQGNDQRQSASRFELHGELSADTKKSADEPKMNFTEHKTPFGQFFENVKSQREIYGTGDAPKLVLAKGFSQGETLSDGLNNVVRFIRADGAQKANLIVDPPALGRISVELVSGTAGLEASIKVSSEQIRQLIQDHMVQLRLSLEQQGVQLTHFSVDVQQDNTRGNQSHGDGTHRRQSRFEAGEEGEELSPGFQVDLNQGLLYWIA